VQFFYSKKEAKLSLVSTNHFLSELVISNTSNLAKGGSLFSKWVLFSISGKKYSPLLHSNYSRPCFSSPFRLITGDDNFMHNLQHGKLGLKTAIVVLMALKLLAMFKNIVFTITILPIILVPIILIYKLKTLMVFNTFVLAKIFAKNSFYKKLSTILSLLPWFQSNRQPTRPTPLLG
jgi:hypothetical protein